MPERKCAGCRRQDEWGCEAEKTGLSDPDTGEATWFRPAALPLTLDDEEWFACPRQDVRQRPQEWAVMLKYYSAYKAGFLPQAGAITDQSNKAIELFRVLDAVSSECDKEEMNRSRSENKGDPADRRR